MSDCMAGNGSIYWSGGSKGDGMGLYSDQLIFQMRLLVVLTEESRRVRHESIINSDLYGLSIPVEKST